MVIFLQGQIITLGEKECYALYRIDYPNSALYTTKNPDGSRYEGNNFNEHMKLIEIKSSPINKRRNDNYECPSRRLHAFTDNTLLNLKYKEERSREDDKIIYNVQSVSFKQVCSRKRNYRLKNLILEMIKLLKMSINLWKIY